MRDATDISDAAASGASSGKRTRLAGANLFPDPIMYSNSLTDSLARRPRMRWLPQLLVPLVAIALLAAVPGWLRHRELTRALESQHYLASLHMAQERYRLAHGRYASDVQQLDLDRPAPTFFAIGQIVPGITGDLQTSWSLTLTRFGETFFYGDYTVTFNERGFDASRSSIDQAISPQRDPVATLAKYVVR